MARKEVDREDLLREATALVRRVSFQLEEASGPWKEVVAGFRRGGEASFFFDVQPVYQFNAACELRRAYVNGRLVKAEQGRLVAMRRERTETEVQLIREPLDDSQTEALLQQASADLIQLGQMLAAGSFKMVGQVPEDGSVLEDVRQWLKLHALDIRTAQAPGIADGTPALE